MSEDAAGKPARFSILTQKGSTQRERTAAIVKEQLRIVGLAVDVVAADSGSLFARFQKGDYDSILFYTPVDSVDPARTPEFWMSAGPFHFWNPNQPRPATDWEATTTT